MKEKFFDRYGEYAVKLTNYELKEEVSLEALYQEFRDRMYEESHRTCPRGECIIGYSATLEELIPEAHTVDSCKDYVFDYCPYCGRKLED